MMSMHIAVHIGQDGLFAYANISGSLVVRDDPVSGLTASSAVLHTSATLINDGWASAGAMCARFALADASGSVVAHGTADVSGVAPGAVAAAKAALTLESAELWSTPRPYLYNLTATVSEGACSGESATGDDLDAVSISTGFRSLHYDANTGFFLNRQHYKVRGFCDHNNLGAVGMAVPERMKLYRAQASRSVGGNGRRTSHNPADPRMLDIYDRVGIVVMEENRKFSNNTAYVDNMRAMVKRDRNHPSITIWSF